MTNFILKTKCWQLLGNCLLIEFKSIDYLFQLLICSALLGWRWFHSLPITRVIFFYLKTDKFDLKNQNFDQLWPWKPQVLTHFILKTKCWPFFTLKTEIVTKNCPSYCINWYLVWLDYPNELVISSNSSTVLWCLVFVLMNLDSIG